MKQNPALVKVAERVLNDACVIRLLGSMGEEITEPFPHEIYENAPFAWGFDVLTDDTHRYLGTIMWDWNNRERPLDFCAAPLMKYL